MKTLKIIFIIAFLTTGCDKTITLPTDGSEVKRIEFPCGSVSIKAIKSFGPGYTISHEFSLNKEVQLDFNSLELQYKNKILPFEVSDANGNKIEEDMISIMGDNAINIYIGQNLVTNDTLFVQMQGFMICEGTSVYDDKLTIVLEDHP